MGFHLHTSNRLERLTDRLAQLMREAPASPFVAESVVVHHLGLGRWLRFELAARLGACVQVEFPLPREYLDRLIQGSVGVEGPEPAYERARLQWHIYSLLEDLPGSSTWDPPRMYLGDGNPVQRWELATQLANLFDQYLVFRSDWIESWSSGAEPHWQAGLWRRLESRIGRESPALRRRKALDALREGATPFPPGLQPPRIALFGLSSLPPAYLEMFAALARLVDVHAFVLQPSCEWWGDIVNHRELRRELHRSKRTVADAEAFHLELGHPLLAAWGVQGRDFLRLWQEQTELMEHADFAEPDSRNRLNRLQTELLLLQTGDVGRQTPDGQEGEPLDDSLLVHSCHSPLRELEVLHDRMLDWFQRDPQLRPRDIVVMAPDISVYAPLIPAIFETPERPEMRIPYSLADRRPGEGRGVVAAFCRILEMVGSRMAVSPVLDLLEYRPLRESMDLDESGLTDLVEWVRSLRVEYGRDAVHLKKLGLPADPLRTWRCAMDRLLAGHAMPDRDAILWVAPSGDEIAPLPGIDGSIAEAAGCLAEFVARLAHTLESWEQTRSATEWVSSFLEAVKVHFSAEGDFADEVVELRTALSVWGGKLAAAGADTRLPFQVVVPSLLSELDTDRTGNGFLMGGVTFCELKPLRSLPFQAICLLGLNEGAFPRSPAPLSFDLLQQQPRLGDRSARADDRYLFLETLISARRWLHLSYLGQSESSTAPIPPSSVIRQMNDHLSAAHPSTDPQPWVVHHRLHGFSAEYFSPEAARGESHYFSFSEVLASAASVSQGHRPGQRPFLSAGFHIDIDPPVTMNTRDLVEFFKHPVRTFLRRKLHLQFHDPFHEHIRELGGEFKAKEQPQLIHRLSQLLLKGRNPVRLAPNLTAEGVLPPGEIGEWVLNRHLASAQKFAAQLRPFYGGNLPPRQQAYSVAVGAYTIEGDARLFGEGCCVHQVPGSIQGKHILALWMEWVSVCAAGVPGLQRGILASPDVTYVWEVPGNPHEILSDLVDLYLQGLQTPLRFFPRTSWEWWSQYRSDDSRRHQATDKARRIWEGDPRSSATPEQEDPSLQTVFGHEENPLTPEFEALAVQFFQTVDSSKAEA